MSDKLITSVNTIPESTYGVQDSESKRIEVEQKYASAYRASTHDPMQVASDGEGSWINRKKHYPN